MSDRVTIALAAAVALGAWVADPPRVAAIGLVAAAAALVLPALGAWRRLVLVCVAALVVASVLAVRAEAGLDAPHAGELRGVATLVGDPQPRTGGVVALVAIDGRRYEAAAWGSPAGTLARSLAGERVLLEGRIEPGGAPRWLRQRHVVARLVVVRVEPGPPGAPLARAAAAVHRVLARSAVPLGDEGPLYRGLVVGDDRDQTDDLRTAFRASGLSHLTAVSGQNVAFALAVASPLLLRLPRRSRAAAALLVIGGFVVLTRAEPSVLRAATMAAVAVVGAASGRQRRAIGALAGSVAALLLIDPLLVRSVGLWLSVLATGGIIVLAVPIADRMRGPRWCRLALAVPVAAQVATAPLLVAVFGSVPLVALPANVAAAPVAGPVMVWGLSGGLLAGALGGTAGSVLQAPVHLGVRWLAGVARVAAAAPVGSLYALHVVALGVAAGVGFAPGAGPRRRRLAAGIGLVAVVLAALGTPAGSEAAAG